MGTRPDLSLDDDSMCTRAYRSGQTVHTDDVAVTGGMPRPGDVHALAIVPLGRFGVVKMGTAEPGGIDPFDVKLVELLAQHAASVLERIAREEALRAARDEAEEMNRLKSSFLANMSHEIRTPLTSVIGFSETLTDFDLDAPACDFAYLIHQSGTRLMHTLESVLSLSQLEAGTMRVHLEVLDAAEVVRAVAASFAVQADTRRLTLYLDLPEEPVPLICDRGALDRIVTNLVGNALKFTDADGRVEVRLADAPDAVTLAVADTGVGIDAAFLPRLFQAFQQESTGNAREYEGVGLGLTLTSHLVELVGGTIDVTSTKGEGTTFTVRFPRGGSV
jgi:signal transduction histidine kinase